jgi:hypothetical protein
MAFPVAIPTIQKDPSASLCYGFDLPVPYTPPGKSRLGPGETGAQTANKVPCLSAESTANLLQTCSQVGERYSLTA